MGAFRRKSYGPVKPVKQPKPVAPPKPSITAYKKILTTMKKQRSWRSAELVARCLLWWRNAEPWIVWQFKTTFPVEAARAHTKAFYLIQKSNHAVTVEQKIERQVAAIKQYQLMAKTLFTVPSVEEPLKEAKANTKKIAAVDKELTVRFDTVLTTLAACFSSSGLEFKAVADLSHFGDGSKLQWKFDEVSKTLYYTRAYLVAMKKRIWREGLLPVLFKEMPTVAKVVYHPEGAGVWSGIQAMAQLQTDIIQYCLHNPDAPNKLVKKPSAKKSKTKTVKVKKGRMINLFKSKSVKQELLDEMGKV